MEKKKIHNIEYYFTKVKIKQMIANMHHRNMPAILVGWNGTRNCSLTLGFTSYSPELVKMGNCAKKLYDYLRQKKT